MDDRHGSPETAGEGAARRHRRASDLFLELIERPASERPAALARIAAEDSGLAREVELLLAADAATASHPLDRPAVAAVEPEPAVEPLATVGGERSYRLLGEIGRGGMGVVHLAERADGEFRQRVAIKLLQGGAARGEEMVRRFRTERQILAALDHPGIAKLLDGGTLADGTPFLVMELVEGRRIDEYCAERRLPIRGRIELFLRVCDAVSAAHRRLVVHRDLKPSNILVTADGDPKLLDFGIAKLLDPESDGVAAAATHEGVQPHTLRYASPEQVRGEPVSTATDVYSLGVVLYELLTERHPLGENLSVPELLRAIGESDPEPPSSAVTRPSRADTADTRSGESRRVRSELSGDLDAVLLKALRKDPTARYGTVDALVDDLRRYLDGRPVLARRGSALYRTGKFLRRHRFTVGAAAAILVLLVGWALTMRTQLARVELERDRSDRTRDLLIEIFSGADPYSPRTNRTLSTREALDLAVPRIRERLAGDPSLRASLLTAVGYLYTMFAEFDAADPVLGEAVEIGRSGLAADPREQTKALRALGWLRFQQSRNREADALYLEALALTTSPSGEPTRMHAVLLVERTAVLSALARHDEAERSVRAGLSELERLGETYERERVFAQVHLATVLVTTWQVAEAERLLADSLRDLERIGANPVRRAAVANMLGSLRYSQGDFAAAEAHFAEAHELYAGELGERHPRTAEVFNNLGLVVFARGDYRRAVDLLERNAALFAEIMGEDHFDVATPRANLGFALVLDGEADRGERLIATALSRHASQLGEKGEVVAYDLWMLSVARFLRGDLQKSLAFGRRCQSAARAALAEGNPQVAACDGVSGLAARWLGESSAEGDLQRCIAAQRANLPALHVDRVTPLAEFASLLSDQGRTDEARGLATEAVEVARATYPAGHWETAWTEAVEAVVRIRIAPGDVEARRALREALAAVEHRFGERHPRVRWAREALDLAP